MGQQVALGDHTPLSENAPELTEKDEDVGPWNLSIITIESCDIGEASIMGDAIGLVIGEAPELFEDIEAGEEIPMPVEEVLLTASRFRGRHDGVCVLEPGTETAEKSMYRSYRDSPAQLVLRWENVEAAVRLLLNGDEYDPEDFSLVDLGNQGFVLIRWSGPGEQADPEASRPAAALIAPDRKPA